jgi:hypothetical protein
LPFLLKKKLKAKFKELKDYLDNGNLIVLLKPNLFVNIRINFKAGSSTWMDSLGENYGIETLVDVNGEDVENDFAD